MKYQAVQKKYCVLEMFTSGWSHCATSEDDNGDTIPSYFDTLMEAKEDMDLFISEVAMEVENGNMEEAYSREDFMVAMFDMDDDGNAICYEIDQPNNIIVKFNAHEEYPNN